MIVYALWHGGASYAPGSIETDLETFDSLAAAKDAFASRAGFDPYYPCVSEDTAEDGGPSMWIFLAEPDSRDPYPDRIIEFGPRGGVQVQNA